MSTGPFVHEALLYRDAGEYLAGTVPFVKEGLDLGEPILVATPPANLALLRDAVGAAADQVQMDDMFRVGRNPARILPAVLLAFTRAHPGQRVRLIGEPVWPGRSALEYPACVQHEALTNTVFADWPATILCPYDVAGLDQVALGDAERTHPLLTTADSRRPSVRFADPVATATSFNLPLPRPPATAVTTPVVLEGLSALRRLVAEQAHAAGVAPSRIIDAAAAVNELASNTVVHAAEPGELAIWPEDGHLVCQITDRGHIADPLAGRIPPPFDASDGRGLLIVNHLCDLVRIHTEPGQTTIRIHVEAGRQPGTL